MAREILKNIYQFEVVLPKSPLKAINVYAIKDTDKILILDTGYNMAESKKSMLENLSEIGVNIEDTELFLTHLHSDHTGLASMFYDSGCRVYASEKDGNSINRMASGKYWSLMGDLLLKFGATEDEIKLMDNPGYAYKLDHEVDFYTLYPGDIIKTGEYEFEVVDMSGHTPGHIGLYEKNKKILFCGDTILNTITPNITFWGDEYGDILGTYMQTIVRLSKLDIKHCLSTHRDRVLDVKKRVRELIEHHAHRLQEILDVMEFGEVLKISDISPRMKWRIRANSWKDFPPAQKFFAYGETMSHMEHLACMGNVEKYEKDGVRYYKKVNPTYELPKF